MTSITSTSTERRTAKIQAMTLLAKLGWTFISPDKALNARDGKLDQAVLHKMLREQLIKQTFVCAGEEYSLSSRSIDQLMGEICIPDLNGGLLSANEKIHNHLLYGISVTEFINDKKITPTIFLVDWAHSKNNSFVFTAEFCVASADGKGTFILDIVCFVNGIPFTVIQLLPTDNSQKKSYAIEACISGILQSQLHNGIPQLFAYSQLLLALDGKDGRYATCGTPVDRWASWQEEDISDLQIQKLKSKKLSSKQLNALLSWCLEPDLNRHAQIQDVDSVISNQDRLLVGLLSPERLLEMTRYFSLFEKKSGRIIAWPQQVFATKRIIERIVPFHRKRRARVMSAEGGVIYHTAGAGKSFTMLFLIQILLQHPALKQYRIVVATHPENVENHLSKMSISGNKLIDKKEEQSVIATSGRRLAEHIASGHQKITFASIEKFNIAIKLPECINKSPHIIVLIEGLPELENQTQMKKRLPQALFIAFTDFPFAEEDKANNLLGSVIHSYASQQTEEYEMPLQESYDAPEVFTFGFDYASDVSHYGYPPKNSSAYQSGIMESTGDYEVERWQETLGNIPAELDANRNAQVYFDIFKKVLPENFFTAITTQEKWISMALEADRLVENAIVDNSINFHNIESDIRQKLLPLIFMECKAIGAGINHTKKIVDLIVQSVYLRIDLD